MRGTAIGACALLALLILSSGCADPASSASTRSDPPALIGQDPVPRVHLFENNASTLPAWRRAGVHERIVVHLDGHADVDWLPDATVARLAAATPDELAALEMHPYSMGGETLDRFGIWNFIYPAARLGLVKELVWVVPDGTLRTQVGAQRLVRELLMQKMQMIRLEDIRAMRYEQRVVRGEILGLPVTICELADLPEFSEPVLLDIDLDYFTTRSALTQYVTERPWILPGQVLRVLWEKRVETDLVTICYSTIGGFMPPSERWLGRSLQRRLRDPSDAASENEQERLRTKKLMVADPAREARAYRDLIALWPEDASLWYGLSEALAAEGRRGESEEARQRAAALDPLLEHGDLFEGDRLWINEGYDAALVRFERYLERFPEGPFTAHALRRRAGCLMRLRRDDEALAAFMEVVERSPEHADSRLDLGILLRERGELERSLEQLRIARRILPERATYAMALGTTYLVSGAASEAVPHLEFAVTRQPCVAAARGNLAAALLELGRDEEAARHVRAALVLQPNNPQFRFVAGQLSRKGIQVTTVNSP